MRWVPQKVKFELFFRVIFFVITLKLLHMLRIMKTLNTKKPVSPSN